MAKNADDGNFCSVFAIFDQLRSFIIAYLVEEVLRIGFSTEEIVIIYYVGAWAFCP